VRASIAQVEQSKEIRKIVRSPWLLSRRFINEDNGLIADDVGGATARASTRGVLRHAPNAWISDNVAASGLQGCRHSG
jgi:hypothetical protein